MASMNVLHINTSDTGSGGAIAANRLHRGLISKGVNSRLLVGHCKSTNQEISIIPQTSKTLEKLAFQVSWRAGLSSLNLLNTFDVPKHDWFQEAQVLNFHNLHGGFFNYLAIKKLTQDRPAIWTLHDMWSFTGHCVYSFDCNRWETGCGECPYPDTYPAIRRDNTAWEWKLKEWSYQNSNIVIVTLSKWLTEQAQNSMLSKFPIHHIPNGIDTDVYLPLDQELCRRSLDIPQSKKVLMFGAQNLSDPRKGGYLLLQALQNLPDSLKAETVLLTIGAVKQSMVDTLGMKSIHLGFLESDRLKVMVYSAADIFVFPTRADNLPLVLQESMACGTPMVSFKVGGVPDLVRHGVTGYLADPEQPEDLCTGIVELLENHDFRMQMRQHCRQTALREYSLELQAQRYVDLYQKTLANYRKGVIA